MYVEAPSDVRTKLEGFFRLLYLAPGAETASDKALLPHGCRRREPHQAVGDLRCHTTSRRTARSFRNGYRRDVLRSDRLGFVRDDNGRFGGASNLR